MPKENQIRVRTKGRGARLEVFAGGRWHSVKMDKDNIRVNRTKPLILEKPKTLRAESIRVNAPNTQIGMSGGDKTQISLNTRITYLKGAAVGRKNFQLPMGIEGQEKVLIVQDYAVGTEPKVYLKTHQSDTTIYTSTAKGQVLHLICDGTYWYLLSTGYATSGSNDAGEWTTN